jgi:hypothetical protein
MFHGKDFAIQANVSLTDHGSIVVMPLTASVIVQQKKPN